ncbi:hypothetical protein AKJ09_02848 [Labilithrix luteola]|uniref:Uncharacterized protein n=1 Tax=Labilithrix luteola TaxID=1391654 RepID=A0A0K1PST3_9BACT|nr:hypothetical protein AKJ09_02848 [Labilithrix luteola]
MPKAPTERRAAGFKNSAQKIKVIEARRTGVADWPGRG